MVSEISRNQIGRYNRDHDAREAEARHIALESPARHRLNENVNQEIITIAVQINYVSLQLASLVT